ncbi:thioesterase II family protein [Leucothrix arctica]|uniref:Putative thioesterase n=1 Tax=Leucothrix arctica TaxID=1481894 RepID=A0A317CSG4_9GAMM|nr:alpha/beta fold hydrolase [Leucothrix arctica]PWQ99262.1 putative thioesterase [Leucothrix arctica]
MSEAKISSPWFTNYGLPINKSVRIFAFPFSGAGPVVYQRWAKQLEQQGIELLGVQLPGRESRYKEKLIIDLKDLIQELATEIQLLPDKECVFFGHSLGALIAFELCRELRRRGAPTPKHLVLSAFRSPSMPNPNAELHNLDDKTLIQRMREYGGTPEAILSNPEFMAIFIPVLRADFKLFETYQYTQEPPLNCPITMLCGQDDRIVKPEYIVGWKDQSTLPVKTILFSGGHFFLEPHKQDVLRLLKDICQQHNLR